MASGEDARGPTPDLVIAGFTKCGTSSLFEWLSLHPQICGSSIKETHFLDDRPAPGAPNIASDGLAGYQAFFRPNPRHQVLLEATPSYVLQETPLATLAELKPPPRVLFMLREPAARVQSEFRYLKHTLEQYARQAVKQAKAS